MELIKQTPTLILSNNNDETKKSSPHHKVLFKTKKTTKSIDLVSQNQRLYLSKKQSNIGGIVTAIDAVQYLPTTKTEKNSKQFEMAQHLRHVLCRAEARVDAARLRIQVSLFLLYSLFLFD